MRWWSVSWLLTASVCGGCRVMDASTAQVERTAHGAGLHRELETLVWVSVGEGQRGCDVMLQEHLPPGAYMDPDQLKRRQLHGELPPFVMGGPVDVEVGEWVAAPSTTLFYPPLHPNPLTGGSHTHTWVMNLTLPVHARYHRGRSSSRHGSEGEVRVPHPSVWMLCPHWPDDCLQLIRPLPCPPGGTHGHHFLGAGADHFEANSDAQSDNEAFTVADKSKRETGSGKSCKRKLVSGGPISESPFSELQSSPIPKGDLPVFTSPENNADQSGFKSRPMCYWLPVHSFSTTEGVSLSVPVGDTDHLEVVLFVTTAVTTAATLLLLTPLLRHYYSTASTGAPQ